MFFFQIFQPVRNGTSGSTGWFWPFWQRIPCGTTLSLLPLFFYICILIVGTLVFIYWYHVYYITNMIYLIWLFPLVLLSLKKYTLLLLSILPEMEMSIMIYSFSVKIPGWKMCRDWCSHDYLICCPVSGLTFISFYIHT